MLNAVSVIGYAAMAGGFMALLLRRSGFTTSPVVVVLQAGAIALMLWARRTFGQGRAVSRFCGSYNSQ